MTLAISWWFFFIFQVGTVLCRRRVFPKKPISRWFLRVSTIHRFVCCTSEKKEMDEKSCRVLRYRLDSFSSPPPAPLLSDGASRISHKSISRSASCNRRRWVYKTIISHEHLGCWVQHTPTNLGYKIIFLCIIHKESCLNKSKRGLSVYTCNKYHPRILFFLQI